MFTLKNLAALVVFGHGLGFTMWWLASWFPRVRMNGPSNSMLFSPGVDISSPVGRAFGLLSLVCAVGFLVVAWGIFQGYAWWPALGGATALVSMVVLVPFFGVIPTINAMGATIVNVALVAAALIPTWADRISPA